MTVLDEVLDRVSPDETERDALREAYETVRERAVEALESRGLDADVELVGSAARDTWLSGDRDIDVFLRLPTTLDRDEFREIGLDVGREVLPDGRVEYAEHPYVTGRLDGYDVDVVPCYDVDEAGDLRSSVDRTPFHNTYVEEAGVDGDEVRLLKAFLRGAGVYGSDLRTRGFSGYLCELLVHHYGGFQEAVEAATEWRPPVVIDLMDHAGEEWDDPLVVVDPTDPGRNVAAVVSRDSFARFVDWSREWENEPRTELFFPEDREPLEPGELEGLLEERRTTLLCLRFEAPDVVDDQLYPQLRKTRRGLVEELERLGFDVIRSAEWADGDCVLLVELNVARQSAVEVHRGPPVHVREHAMEFKRKYRDSEAVGPYVCDGRYVVERSRRHRTAQEFVESNDFLDVGMGKHVEEKLREGYEILVDGECVELLDEFGVEFRRYFEPG